MKLPRRRRRVRTTQDSVSHLSYIQVHVLIGQAEAKLREQRRALRHLVAKLTHDYNK